MPESELSGNSLEESTGRNDEREHGMPGKQYMEEVR